MNKLLLWFTGIVMIAFVFTFPTRDRRGAIDKIRMHVGAKHLVSKETLKELNTEQNKISRQLASTPPMERQEKLNQSVKHHCNEAFNHKTCSQYLNYCGESCRMLVNPATWKAIMSPKKSKPAVAKKARPPATRTARR